MIFKTRLVSNLRNIYSHARVKINCNNVVFFNFPRSTYLPLIIMHNFDSVNIFPSTFTKQLKPVITVQLFLQLVSRNSMQTESFTLDPCNLVKLRVPFPTTFIASFVWRYRFSSCPRISYLTYRDRRVKLIFFRPKMAIFLFNSVESFDRSRTNLHSFDLMSVARIAMRDDRHPYKA